MSENAHTRNFLFRNKSIEIFYANSQIIIFAIDG